MRNVHINGQEWEWRAGKQNVVIRSPHSKVFVIGCHKIKNARQTPDMFQRERDRSRSEFGMIKPSEVKKYIEEHLV